MLKIVLTKLANGDAKQHPSWAGTTLPALLKSLSVESFVAVRNPQRVLSLIDPGGLPMAQKSYRPYGLGYLFLNFDP
jgi:hypothetical protein